MQQRAALGPGVLAAIPRDLTDVVPFLVEDMLKANGGTYEKGADWYFEGDVAFTLYTPCPSEEGDMVSLSNWPIGPIPG